MSYPFVESVRSKLTGNGFQSPTKRTGADGRAIDTTNIGARGRTVEEHPNAQSSMGGALPRSSHVASDADTKEAGSDRGSAVDDLDAAAKAFLGFLSHESGRLEDSVGQGHVSAQDADRQLTAVVLSGAVVLNQTRDEIVRIAEDVARRIAAMGLSG